MNKDYWKLHLKCEKCGYFMWMSDDRTWIKDSVETQSQTTYKFWWESPKFEKLENDAKKKEAAKNAASDQINNVLDAVLKPEDDLLREAMLHWKAAAQIGALEFPKILQETRQTQRLALLMDGVGEAYDGLIVKMLLSFWKESVRAEAARLVPNPWGRGRVRRAATRKRPTTPASSPAPGRAAWDGAGPSDSCCL